MDTATRILRVGLLALLLLPPTLFLAASLVTYDPADPPSTLVYPRNPIVRNCCGRLGALLATSVIDMTGVGAFVIAFLMGYLSFSLMLGTSKRKLARQTIGALALTVALLVFAQLLVPPTMIASVSGPGGVLGSLIAHYLDGQVSRVGTHLVVGSASALGALLAFDSWLIGLGLLTYKTGQAVAGLLLASLTTLGKFFTVSARTESITTVLPVQFLPTAKLGTITYQINQHRESGFLDTKPSTSIASFDYRPLIIKGLDGPAPSKTMATPLISEPKTDEWIFTKVTEDTLPVNKVESASEDVSNPVALDSAPIPATNDERQDLRINRNGLDTMDIPRTAIIPESPSVIQLPELDILDEPEPFEYKDYEQEVRERAMLLEKTCAEFQINVRVVQIDTGPVVTQYEIELEPGLRARKVMALSDDLAIALRVPSVRIVAPIPGKNTVGIEVPNERRAKVTIKEVMGKGLAQSSNMRLPVFLGKDVKGLPLVCDLANLPHLLIAGRTGTGKSVCLNTLILSILMSRTPEQVKMLMIDPKMVELSLYKEVPHLLHPVVTDMRKAEALLGWAVDQMEERYELLARIGVRHIEAYNKLSREDVVRRYKPADDAEKEKIPQKLPYILIFADEIADLMMTAAKEVEGHIIRLAQKSRAVGIHLVLATQKPTVDVVTGLIKSNLPARIAFQVASRTDSRVVLDEMGAEKLLGNGDMLFLYPGTSKIIRAQGTYVSDDEINRVTTYLADQAGPQFSPELLELETRGSEAKREPNSLDDRQDDVYKSAVELVIREQRGSVSLLQRGLGIGYGRAARLIDFMAEDGIVGEYNGSQAREVLYTPDQWEEVKRTRWQLAS